MNTHYYKRYMKLIEHMKNNPPEEGEQHHIIPKCIGGSNDEDNIVLLGYRQHFIAHYMLAKAYPEHPKLWYAFNQMKRVCEGRSVLYEAARKYISWVIANDKERSLKISLAHKGKKLSYETRMKLSEGRMGEKNWRYNTNHTEETKRKMSENGIKGKSIYHHTKTGKNIYLSEDEEVPDGYEKGAGWLFGNKAKNRKYSMKWWHNPDTKEQVRLGHDETGPIGFVKGRLPLPKTECCGKMYDPGNFKKHRRMIHGE